MRLTRGDGTRAARRAIKSSGSNTTSVVPSRYGVDIGVLDLKDKESLKYGTYENVFTCLQAVKTEADGCDVESKIIDAKFYEDEGTVVFKVVTFFDCDGDVSDREIYWFDSEENDIPSNNSNWFNIIENMDIF